jgi:hypothetical protein
MSTPTQPSRVIRIVRPLLIGLAAFCFVLAGVLAFWAPTHVIKTPLDKNATIRFTGEGELLNPATGQLRKVPIKVTKRIVVDTAASDDDNVVLVQSQCVVIATDNPPPCVKTSDPRFVSIDLDRVAMDRRSGEAVNDAKYKESLDGKPVKHVGLTYRFPFDTEKKTYQRFNGDVQKAFDAKYVGTTTVAGLKAYKFEVTTPKTASDVIPGVPGFYEDTATIFVEPETGSILAATDHQVRTLENGQKAVEINVATGDTGAADNINNAKDGIDQIRLLTKTLPIVLVIIGVLAAVGAWLLGRRRNRGAGSPAVPPTTPPDGFGPSDGAPNWAPPPPPGNYEHQG